jgi:O-antigen ligase
VLIRLDRLVPALLGLATGLIFAGIEIKLGAKFRPFDLLVLLAIALTLLAAAQHGLRRADTSLLTIAVIAYGGLMFANAALLSSMTDAVRETLQLAFFALFVTCFIRMVDSAHGTTIYLGWAFWCLLAVALGNAAWHLGQGIWSGWKTLDEPKLSHSLLVVLLAALPVRSRPRGFGALMALALAMLILSGERKGWIAAAGAIATLALFLPAGSNLPRLAQGAVIVAMIALAAALLVPNVPYLQKQVESSREFVALLQGGVTAARLEAEETTVSNRARLYGISVAREMIRAKPVFGVGLANYDRRVEAMDIPEVYRKGAHNEALRIAAELGAVGLALYILIHTAILARIVQLRRHLGRLPDHSVFRYRFGCATLTYGIVANLFLGGGGVNLFLVFLPAALVFSVPYAATTVEPPNSMLRRAAPSA